MKDQSAQANEARDSAAPDPPRSVSVSTVRVALASAVWLVAVIAAVVLATGALLVALDFNLDNPLVSFVTETAARLDLGELKSFDPGSTTESAEEALRRSVLVNWGLAAVIYLILGKIADRLIRP